MNDINLPDLVESYEMLFQYGEILCRREGHTAYILFNLYAMMSALQLRVCIGVSRSNEIENITECDKTEGYVLAREALPEHEAVQKAGRELLAAVASEDKAGISSALEEMGVFILCPIPDHQFQRMEVVVGSLQGRARPVVLVELSCLAAELEDYERASRYAQVARSLNPGSWERYNLCMIEGLVALNAGRDREAVQCLARSFRECLTDEYASLDCGIRAPNFALAQRLLAQGERVEVLRHLLQCKDVWQFFYKQLDKWISLIESGETPDFGKSGIVNSMMQPATRVQTQWVLACSPEEKPGGYSTKSPSTVKAAREKLLAVYRRQMNASIDDQAGGPGPGSK